MTEPNLDDYSDDELRQRLVQRGWEPHDAAAAVHLARNAIPAAVEVCLRAVGGLGG